MRWVDRAVIRRQKEPLEVTQLEHRLAPVHSTKSGHDNPDNLARTGVCARRSHYDTMEYKCRADFVPSRLGTKHEGKKTEFGVMCFGFHIITEPRLHTPKRLHKSLKRLQNARKLFYFV